MARAKVRKRKDGSAYEGRYVDFTYRGVRVARGIDATNKQEVDRWVRRKKEEIDQQAAASLLSTGSLRNLTLGQAAMRYVEEHLRHTPGTETSKRWEAGRLSKIVSALGTNKKLEDLTTADVKAVVARALASGDTPQTANRDLHPLRAMHNMARDVWEYPNLRTVAWKKVRASEPKVEIEPPRVDEIKAIIMHATERLARVIMFATLTGLRKDEIKKLSWDGFKPAAGEEPATVRFRGKGGKTVTLPIGLAATSLVLSTPREASSTIFDMTNFDREWTRAKKKAGRPDTRFHDLRHAFATLFRATTKDPMALKDAMRHSDLATSSIYAHADKSHLLPSLEAVATKLLGSSSELKTMSPTESDGQSDLFGER